LKEHLISCFLISILSCSKSSQIFSTTYHQSIVIYICL